MDGQAFFSKLSMFITFQILPCQGSHFFELTKFHDISRFFSKFPGIFSLSLKYDFQVVLNINLQTY